MTISLPSKEVFSLDVPEVKKFIADFKYNFHTPDETLNDSGQIPEQEFKLNANALDDATIKLLTARLPRYVEFTIKPSRLIAFNLNENQMNLVNTNHQKISISKNIDKIISEDDFSSNSFVSVNFNDGYIEDKIHDVISGSVVELSLNSEVDLNTTKTKIAKQLDTLTSDSDVDVSFLTKYFGGLDKKLVKFFSSREGKDRVRKMSSDNTNGTKSTTHSGDSKIELKDVIYQDVHNVNLHVQINSKIFNDVVKRQIVDPISLFANDMIGLQEFSKKVQDNSRKNILPSDDDYRSLIPFIDVKVQNTTFLSDNSTVEVVGFIIDKVEINDRGESKPCDSIILENPNTTYAIDTKVKYNTRYRYQIRTITVFSLPAIDNDSGDIGIIRTLVSSKPSRPFYILCDEQLAPPPPADIEFVWNYEINKLSLNWSFPVNTQRDIKYFQVFRRTRLEDAFELVKMFDFDDSEIRAQLNEKPDNKLIAKLVNPLTVWTDDEFEKNNRFIYSIVSIDAHGLSSGYSAQYEVWFDIFKNKLQKKLVSHSGAPKPYPNMYVGNQLFIDSIKSSGSKRMKLIFNPEYYDLVDNENKTIKVVSTKQDGASYQINILNLDNQKSDVVNVRIDDRRSANTSVNTNKFVIGQTKK